MITCYFIVTDRIELLPKFIDYYRMMGVDRFVVIMTGGASNPYYDRVSDLMPQSGIDYGRDFDAHPAGIKDNDAMNAVRRRTSSDWDVVADLDEFHYFNGPSIRDVIGAMYTLGAEVATTKLVDRITIREIGDFPKIPQCPMDDLFSVKCNLTEAIGGNINKVAIVKNGIDTTPGHHYAPGRALSCGFETHHFKWTAGIVERTKALMAESGHLHPQPPEQAERRELLRWIDTGKLIVPPDKKLDIQLAERINV